jgi:hypothetical protein
MPPVSQSNRGALVTWAVVTGIGFVVCAVLAIYFYVDSSKSATRSAELIKKYNDYIAPGDLAGQAVTDLRAIRSSETPPPGVTASTPLFNVLVEQRNQFAGLVGGPTAKDAPGIASPAAAAALTRASAVAKDAGITIPTSDNLAGAVSALSDGLNSTLQQKKDLQQQVAAGKAQQADQVKQFDSARAEMNKTVESIRAGEAKAQSDVTAYTETKNADVAQIEQSHAQQVAALQQQVAQAQVQLGEHQRTIDALKEDNDKLKVKLGEGKIKTEDVVLRQADGRILRIPSKDTLYIDLGSLNSITPGLTFEVYDKFEGIPKLTGADEEAMPKGKASIEVTRVGSNSSEARLTRQTPGTQLTEGDLIANIVYDPNTKYTFMVYGDFDLDQNNLPSPQETETVKRLITQWGGKLTDQVNVDTDFVVMGKEPVLPTFAKDELQDPFNAKKLADAQAALDQYLAIKKQGIDLHIPVLNQNRFLYLIGYYAQAKR